VNMQTPQKRLEVMAGKTSRFRFRSILMVVAALIMLKIGFPETWSQELKSPAVPGGIAPATSHPGEQALNRLLEGNERYVAGKAIHPDQTIKRRIDLANGQTPFAVVLTCSDSRVAPELFFDQGLGDLFVIRNAGNVLDDHVIGTMEYAVEHLHVSLIIVVGHEKCGAVTAAVAGGEVSGHIRSLVDDIEPAVEESKDLPGDKVDNAVRANALRAAEILNHVEPILKEAVGDNKLMIVAARYDLDTGRVEILKPSKSNNSNTQTP